MKQLENQVDTLSTRNQIQEEEMEDMKRAIKELLVNAQMSNSSNRKIRSVSSNNSPVDSTKNPKDYFCSKLDVLSYMQFGQYRLKIYKALATNRLSTDIVTEKFFYDPICVLNHHSAVSFIQNQTNQPAGVRFKIDMWNEEMEEEVVKFITNFVGRQIRPEQVSVFPFENVFLSSKTPSELYELSNQFTDNRGYKSLTFTLTCKRLMDCSQVAEQMRSSPLQFGHFRLHFSSSSPENKTITIRINNIVTGNMMTKLNQKYQEKGQVLLTADDEKILLTESMTNVIADTFEESAMISSDFQKRIYNLLKYIFGSSRLEITNQTDNRWDLVYWKDDEYRPDRATTTLNDIVKNLTNDDQNKIKSAFSRASSGRESLSVARRWEIFADLQHKLESYSKEDLEKLVEASKDTVDWDGQKFYPKRISLFRIDMTVVRDSHTFPERKMRVDYKTAVLSLPVHIDKNLTESSVHENVMLPSHRPSLEGV